MIITSSIAVYAGHKLMEKADEDLRRAEVLEEDKRYESSTHSRTSGWFKKVLGATILVAGACGCVHAVDKVVNGNRLVK